MFGQAVDLHHPLGIHASHRVHFSCLGSSASRRPSPSRLNPSTARKIAEPGKIDIPGAWVMKFLAVFSIEPHDRSDEHPSELQSLMRISYSVFCLNKKIFTRSTLTYSH